MRPRSPREILTPSGLSAFLCTDLTNIRYLTGVVVSSGMVLVTGKRIMLFVDGRYRFEVEHLVLPGIAVRDIADLPRIMQAEKTCGFEAEHVSVGERSAWKKIFSATKFVPTSGIIEEFRRSKSDQELRLMQRAHRMTKELLRRVPAALRKGVTEEKLARQFGIWALELGADGLAFPPIVAFGTHTGIPHHVSGPRSLKKGHLVQVDVGVKYRGYCSDLSRVFFTAAPTPLQKRVFETLLRVQDEVIKEAKPGVTNRALDRRARTILAKEGLEEAFSHALGHGLGLDIHEGVVLSQKRREMKLLKNEVVTVEPGVYFPGKFGMRIEDQMFLS